MDEKNKNEIKDFIFQAIQAGKKESSGLVGDIMKKLDSAIEVSVKKHVNGNIEGIKIQLENYIKEDTDWKTRAEHVIQLGNDTRGASKAILWLTGIIIAVGGAILMVKQFLK